MAEKIIRPTPCQWPPDDPASNARPQGNVQSPGQAIFITKSALRAFSSHASADTTRSRGGILYGTQCIAGDRAFTAIVGFLSPAGGTAKAASFKFTQEFWLALQAEKEARYPSSLMVGWTITLPSFGVFMSSMNLMLQQQYFDLPWQVHAAIDPVGGSMAFFKWHQGKMIDTGFYVVERVPGVPHGE